MISIITEAPAGDFSDEQITVFENIVLAKVTAEHCPEYGVNLANVMKEILRVKLEDNDFAGRRFDIAKDKAEKAFVGLSLKHLNVCRYIYTRMGDYSDYPILEEKVWREK